MKIVDLIRYNPKLRSVKLNGDASPTGIMEMWTDVPKGASPSDGHVVWLAARPRKLVKPALVVPLELGIISEDADNVYTYTIRPTLSKDDVIHYVTVGYATKDDNIRVVHGEFLYQGDPIDYDTVNGYLWVKFVYAGKR